MIFKKGSQNGTFNLYYVLKGTKLDIVTEYKYLGSILSSDMSVTLDMEKCTNAFNKIIFVKEISVTLSNYI